MAAFGQDVLPVVDLKDAKVIVSFDADLFGDGSPLAIKYARDFAAGRKLYDKDKQKEMNRLYVIESLHTITGACADHRAACRAGEIETVAGDLAAALGVNVSGTLRVPPVIGTRSVPDTLLAAIKTDLEENVGHSVVVAGPRQPAAVHALVAAINVELHNVGKTVQYYSDPQSDPEGVAQLVQRMKSGAVDKLLILGGNPAYDAPADLDFAEGLKKVKTSAHLSLHNDETSQLCTWHLSRAHYLESWGDARTFDGTASIVQPLIEPLFDGRSAIEVLSMIADEEPRRGHEMVRETVKSLVSGPPTEYRWKKLLAEGVIEGTAWKPVKIEKLADGARSTGFSRNPSDFPPKGGTTSAAAMTNSGASSPHPDPLPEGEGDYELVFYRDKIHGGRFANNGWLQELPDPMTRLTWDNAAVMSPKTAEKIGAKQDELVELSGWRCEDRGPRLLHARHGRRRDRHRAGLWPHGRGSRRQRCRRQRLSAADDD